MFPKSLRFRSRRPRRVESAVQGILAAWLLLLIPAAGAFSQDDDDDAHRRERLREEMRERAEATKIYSIEDSRRTPATLVPQPIFRFSDQPRIIIDATLWCWTVEERPVAFQKIEGYRRGGPDEARWTYCARSLSTGLIEGEWRDGTRWTATEPGLVFRPLPDGPEPSASKAGRLTQMRRIGRRFSCTLIDPPLKSSHQMRFLPQPLYRYEQPESGLVDGAVFAFAYNGTNPDGLLAIELRRNGSKPPAWHYAATGMTMCGLSFTLNDQEVWSKPYKAGPAAYESWLWFWESTAESDSTPEAQQPRTK